MKKKLSMNLSPIYFRTELLVVKHNSLGFPLDSERPQVKISTALESLCSETLKDEN